MVRRIINKKDIRRVVKGYIISLATALIVVFGVTICIRNEYIDIKTSGYLAPAVWGVCSLIGAFTTGERGEKVKIQLQILTCTMLFLSVLSIGTIAFDGGNGSMIAMNLIATATGGFGGILLRMRKNKRIRIRKRRYTSR